MRVLGSEPSNVSPKVVIVYQLGRGLDYQYLSQMAPSDRFIFRHPDLYGHGVYRRHSDKVVENVISGKWVNGKLRNDVQVYTVYGDYVIS